MAPTRLRPLALIKVGLLMTLTHVSILTDAAPAATCQIVHSVSTGIGPQPPRKRDGAPRERRTQRGQ